MKSKLIEEKSCGCIILNNKKVLLVHQNKGNWGFPKGHIEDNETEQETAIREVKEETNIDVQIKNNKRFSEQYITDKGTLKEVIYFIAKPLSGNIKPQEEEIKEIKWVNINEAFDIISYDNTKEMFKEVLKEMNL